MRILVCNWKDMAHPAAGGAEVYTHEITRRWAATGHEVTWFAAAVPGRPAEEFVEGVRVLRAGGRFSVYREARRRVAPRDYDLIIDEINTRPFDCPAWCGNVPVVAFAHQVCREIWWHEMPWPVAALGRWVAEPMWLGRYRDVPTLTVSDSSRKSLWEAGLRDVSIVGEGLARRSRPDVEREPRPTLIFLGRMCSSKRPQDVIAAHALVRESIPDAQLWMVGAGPMEDRLRRLAAPGVRIFGRVPESERDELLARAHALVMASVREGWALVVDEAAAMGTPSVAYDRPGLRDSVTAAGGVLTAPRPAALAAALTGLLPQWTRNPRATGWQGGALNWEAVADRFLDLAIQAAKVNA